jgi:hypothetical protein
MLDQGHNVYDPSLTPLHAVDKVNGQGKSAVCLVVIQPMWNSCVFLVK